MQSNSIEPFLDNWAYLKAELTWLDRLLMLAIARQRKETKAVDRLAQNKADRVTSHWWKGIISVEGDAAYDDYIPNRAAQKVAKVSHQQQIENRIRASLEQGCALGLPWLRDRLKLSVFEKNLLLIGLAPEVNQRYARLYGYLQGNEASNPPSLPTVDLVLRLLCRNDSEWRSARHLLTAGSPLLQYRLLEVLENSSSTWLMRSLKLPDSLVNFLLAEQPEPAYLEAFLQSTPQVITIASVQPQSHLNTWNPSQPSHSSDPWAKLILPETLIKTLQHLCHRVQWRDDVEQTWGFAATDSTSIGTVTLLSGATGTGKTSAAKTIAQTLQTQLFWLDLAQLRSKDAAQVLHEIATRSPKVLLLKSADCWFGRGTPLSKAELNCFLHDRQQKNCITLLQAPRQEALSLHWRRQMDYILPFPQPNETARLQLWQQAFPAQVSLNPDIDFVSLARQLKLNGGEIMNLACDAAFYAIAESAEQLSMSHLQQAIAAFPKFKGRIRQ
jgi:hypothetical protein